MVERRKPSLFLVPYTLYMTFLLKGLLMESNAAESPQPGQSNAQTPSSQQEHIPAQGLTLSSGSGAMTPSQQFINPFKNTTINKQKKHAHASRANSNEQHTNKIPIPAQPLLHTRSMHRYAIADISTHKITTFMAARMPHLFAHETHNMMTEDTLRLPNRPTTTPLPPFPPGPHAKPLAPATALLFMLLLCVLVLNSLSNGATQFVSAQGWSYILHGPTTTKSTNLLKPVGKTHGTMTPQQYIATIVDGMSLDQKLGQMMMVQFTGSTDANDIQTMITQQYVGAVLLSPANGNILNASQLTELTSSMQSNSQHYNSALPLSIATDQEGGAVDRLLNLDGSSPAERTIGDTNNSDKARQQGMLDAQHFSEYGLNLNLAPVVDVDTQPASELHQDLRTYSSNPNTVSAMAQAYLQGLQQSGKVVGTLKHFPGLGSVATDPHVALPVLDRSVQQIEQEDWAPYTSLISTGEVHAIMVTHELVPALDPNEPASLSSKIIQGVLRNQMHFQGVIMTDSVTMQSLDAYDNGDPNQAAVLSVGAGSDMIIGASSPNEVATIVNDLTQAINAGSIPLTQINASVQRILLMKYAMRLLPIPTHSQN